MIRLEGRLVSAVRGSTAFVTVIAVGVATEPPEGSDTVFLRTERPNGYVMTDSEHLEKVRLELARYEHPLFTWEATATSRGIEVTVQLKEQGIHNDPYKFCLIAREIEAPAFQWDFQRQLYNYLHDYLVEMFTRSPHIREY